jgi:CelD/BcsL family acetyltransferase involved in cellulose biosynthesis
MIRAEAAQDAPMLATEFAPVRTRSASQAECAVEVIEGADAVMRAEADWRALADLGGVPTPFQSFAVASAAAAAHARRGETPRLSIARRDGRAIALVPAVATSLLGMRALRFLGDPLIQYGDVLAAPDARAEDIAAAWSAAVSPRAAGLALMRRVRDDAHIAPHLADGAAEIDVQESPLVEFSQPSTLTPRNARELRRLRRRLGDLGPVEMQVLCGPEADAFLSQALELKRDWIKMQALASAVIGDPDWEGALHDICRAGALTVAVLKVGGTLAALEVAFRDSACWYGFLGVFVEDFARMGPGQVLTADCIAHAREAGLACYDPLPPAHPYKREQATRMLGVRDYAIPLTQTGRLVQAAARMLPEMKSIFGALPAEVRRPLLALSGR